jgi:hypothetical protein
MADEDNNEEVMDTTVSDMWLLAKPPAEVEENEDEDAAPKPSLGAKVGKLVKLLNDIEEPEELEQKLQERDPATGESLLMWATLSGKFVLVEWLVKKAKRHAFAFTNDAKEITVYEKWAEVRKEIDEREREKLLNPPEEEEEPEEEEDKPEEPKPEEQVLEGLSEYHEDFGNRGMCIVKTVGELGVYQGARDGDGAKTGLGQSLFPNGDMYCGEYKDNQRDGTGTYHFAADGMTYSGAWNANVRQGVGRMVYADGGRYYGTWVNDQRSGNGRFTYPDGSSYDGEWQKDAKRGKGAYTFADGSQYLGRFVDGEFASGEWRIGGGTRYLGSFKEGAPVGKGVFIFHSGKEGSFRQEGRYTAGQWHPSAVAASESVPSLELVIQKKTLEVGFTRECAGMSTETLVQVVNFPAFQAWLDAVEASNAFFVNGVEVAAVRFDTAGNVSEVRINVVAVNAAGARLKNTRDVILKNPEQRLMLLLAGGGKTLAIVQQSPNITMHTGEQLALPTITSSSTGEILGDFANIVGPALRVPLHLSKTMPLPINLINDAGASSAKQSVVTFIQNVHADAIAAAQGRLDAACEGHGFASIRAIRLEDVSSMTTDALTMVAASVVSGLLAKGQLPEATVDAQRPPTPVPPPMEERPDIEALLESERLKNAPPPADDDE